MQCAMLYCMTTDTDIIGTAEACAILGKHAATLGRWIDSGRIQPATKLPGRNGAWLFWRTEVEQLRDELAAEASA